MSTPFHRTLRALGASAPRPGTAGVLAALVLLGTWLAWGMYGRVSVYEVTAQARIEVAQASTPVQAPMDGRVLTSRLRAGRDVRVGEILFELEAETERLQLAAARARMDAAVPQIAALRRQMDAEEQARASEGRVSESAVEVARAAERQSQAPARFAADELQRLEQLRKNGLIADREYRQGVADAQQTRASAESAGIAITRLEREQATRDRERDVRLERLRADILRFEGDVESQRAAIRGLEYELERRHVRAPVSGRLAESEDLHPGAWLKAGQNVATILPTQTLLVVAQYPPHAAFGRLRPGQAGRMRLEGFPWAEYGVVDVCVRRVAEEVRDGRVRVDLLVAHGVPPQISLQHGLPGVVEIEVEQVSPATLLLRAVGQKLANPLPAPASAEAAP